MSGEAPRPLLEARGISVGVGDARLLDDVDLDLLPGTVTCLLGPNGAGKSILLHVLTGALPPNRDEVQFGQQPLGRPEELARARAVLSQSTTLGFVFRVIEVVALGRSPHVGQSSAALDRQIVDAAMAAADVTHLADRRYPTASSSGFSSRACSRS